MRRVQESHKLLNINNTTLNLQVGIVKKVTAINYEQPIFFMNTGLLLMDKSTLLLFASINLPRCSESEYAFLKIREASFIFFMRGRKREKKYANYFNRFILNECIY